MSHVCIMSQQQQLHQALFHVSAAQSGSTEFVWLWTCHPIHVLCIVGDKSSASLDFFYISMHGYAADVAFVCMLCSTFSLAASWTVSGILLLKKPPRHLLCHLTVKLQNFFSRPLTFHFHINSSFNFYF